VFSRFIRVLAADAPRLHGLTPSLAIIDELHAHRDDEVYLAMRTAVLKRPGSKLVVISTAAQGSDTPLAKLRSRALGQPSVKRRGAVIDAKGETVRLLEWSAPKDTDVNDLKAAKAANPATWISIPGLRAQKEAVHELAYRRYHLNQFTEAGNTWLAPGSWQSCAGEPRFKDGERIFVAVDLGGGQRSTSAVVWCNRDLQIGCEISADEYPVEFVLEVVNRLAKRYRITELTADEWRAPGLFEEAKQRGIPVTVFPQSDARMCPASQRTYEAIVEGRLTHPDDPDLNRHVAQAVARDTRYRGWRVDRPDRNTPVDGAVAMVMCVTRRSSHRRPRPSSWGGSDAESVPRTLRAASGGLVLLELQAAAELARSAARPSATGVERAGAGGVRAPVRPLRQDRSAG
jgi:phage terminase large subunit-like protein